MNKIISVLLLLLSYNINAQIEQLIRKEYNVKESSLSNVVTLEEKGLVTYGYQTEQGKRYLELRAYNTDFEEIHSFETEIPLKKQFGGSYHKDGTNEIYFYSAYKSEFNYIVYNIEEGTTSKKEFKLENGFVCSGFYTVGETIFVRGILKKLQTIMVYDINSGKQTYITLPGENKKRIIHSVQFDNTNENLVIFYRDGKDMRTSSMYVFAINTEGTISMKPLLLEKDDKYSIIGGNVTWIGDNEFLITGTYGINRNSIASGIFFSKWSDGNQELITYHSFTDLKNFHQFLSEKAQMKIEKKVKKKKEKGVEEVVKTFVTNHPITIQKDEYIYVGESYYPTYRTETYTTFVNGKSVTNTRQVFDGYQYTHAVILGFDKEGNRLYDHCFDISLNYKPMQVIRSIRITTDKDRTKLLYVGNQSIRAVFIENEEISEKIYGEIITDLEGDKVKYSTTNSNYWYDNYYIIYGNQKIKNKESDNTKKRVVFFMTKIRFNE